jgi:hypothetical protein
MCPVNILDLAPRIVAVAALLLVVTSIECQTLPRKLPQSLSRQELKACILREDRLEEQDKKVRQAYEEHLQSSSQLSEEAKALAEMLRIIDNSNPAAVDSFNLRNEQRNKAVDRHNQLAGALNDLTESLRIEQIDYISACVARPFLMDDERAVLKELGRPANSRRRVPKPTETPSSNIPGPSA